MSLYNFYVEFHFPLRRFISYQTSDVRTNVYFVSLLMWMCMPSHTHTHTVVELHTLFINRLSFIYTYIHTFIHSMDPLLCHEDSRMWNKS